MLKFRRSEGQCRPRKRAMSKAEWVTKMSLIAKNNRPLYRELRALMWRFVIENSARSDFPSEFS